MKRTTIMLPDDLDARLRHEARRRGVSIADVARRAIEEQLPEPGQGGKLSFFGVGRSGQRDTARRAEEILAREWGDAGGR